MENRNEAVTVSDRRSSSYPSPQAIDDPLMALVSQDLNLGEALGLQPIDETIVSNTNAVNPKQPSRPKRTIIPWGERILVKPDPPEEFFSKDADIKKAEVNQEKALEGTVVAIGIDFKLDYRLPIPRGQVRIPQPADGGDLGRGTGQTWAELQVGDKVGYVKFTGAEFNEGDEEFLMLRPDEVLCVILLTGQEA